MCSVYFNINHLNNGVKARYSVVGRTVHGLVLEGSVEWCCVADLGGFLRGDFYG